MVALQSVLHETASLPQLEILVVDDSPLEAAVEQQLRTIDPEGRIAYHHNATRLGIGGNWNRAIELSRGTWIHLLHQDDHILPGFYRQLAPALESSVSFAWPFAAPESLISMAVGVRHRRASLGELDNYAVGSRPSPSASDCKRRG